MTILADSHLHSSFSNDSDTPMEEMILRGIEIGLTHMCFTEHQDFDFPDTPGYPPASADCLLTDAYLYDLLRFQEKYINQIRLHFGIELGLQPHVAALNEALAKAYDFDFIIGSSHACQGYNPYYPPFFADKTNEEAYAIYFDSIWENLQVFNDYDVLGHLDYVVRYGKQPNRYYESIDLYQDVFDRILRHLIANGKGIELNTGGIKNGLKEFHPATILLRRYLALGGEVITIGSDSHQTKGIAQHFDQACELLRSLGFRYYAIFIKRKPVFYPL
ncbi:MAG: histidinol-phosphatase HisJ family protein [Lachnospiraceae bacterium]|jgi:histidinol-phosphatase (PHP family)|nr:histidinol-phosphatase HisJ family protein [Lachnospiraceae bacterium]